MEGINRMSDQFAGQYENFIQGCKRGLEEARTQVIDIFSTYSNDNVIKMNKLEEKSYRETVALLGHELLIKLDELIRRVKNEDQ